MKFSSKETKLTSSQKTMAIELGLADQKKAIELLYSQYSRPIQTCVQELVSNAFDAHRVANNQHTPVKITLPNEVNDFHFSVRDFGNSMDDDTIKNVYMRVNASTKSGNNKDIGGFGIGSKTPWAYTDTFILKTFLNGLETQYALVKGRSSVSIVYRGETTEPNGTEVIFKTKERDKDDFKKAVRRISLCAKVKPIVNADIELHFKEEVRLSPTVRLVKTNLLDLGIYANVGGVLYWLGSEFIPNNHPRYSRHYTYNQRLTNILSNETSLILDLPIGALLPLQTREGLFKGGEEGQNNKAVMKKVFKKALEVIESTLEAKEKMANNPLAAIDYFSDGMLVSHKTFKFGELEVNLYGLEFRLAGQISVLTRRYSRGYGKVQTIKKQTTAALNYSEVSKGRIYFSEMSPNKARLSNRFHNKAALNDVIVIEKHNFKNLEVYEFLKSYTKARNIEEVEVEKIERGTKGQSVDKTKVVVYDMNGSIRLRFFINKNVQTKKTIVLGKNTNLPHSSKLYKKLGFDVWWVADSNVNKLLELGAPFTTKEKALDLAKVKELYINYRVKEVIDRLKRKNLSYIISMANPNKQKLFIPVGEDFDFYYHGDIVDLLKKTYGERQLDAEVQSVLKRRFRAAQLADKAPLAQYIDRPESLKGKAKADLDNYIAQNVGVWYGHPSL